jgi:hypothetical protein
MPPTTPAGRPGVPIGLPHGLPHGPVRPACPPDDLGRLILALPRGPARELRVTVIPASPASRADRPGGVGSVHDNGRDGGKGRGEPGESREDVAGGGVAVRLREWFEVPGSGWWPLPGRSVIVRAEELVAVIAALGEVVDRSLENRKRTAVDHGQGEGCW